MDANRSGLGIVCFREGECLFLSRLVLPIDIVELFDENKLSINVLETAAAVLGLLVLRERVSEEEWNTMVIRVRGDSSSATSWLTRGGAKGAAAGALVKLLSPLHEEGRVHITYRWREGKRYELADFLSRIQNGVANDNKLKFDPNMTDEEIINFCHTNFAHIYTQFQLKSATFARPSSFSVESLLKALRSSDEEENDPPPGWIRCGTLEISERNHKITNKESRFQTSRKENCGKEPGR